MGVDYGFCDCKDNKDGEEKNLGIMDDINNLICPMKKVSTKKDFTFRSENQNLTIDDYTRKAAVNKIIKIYREYKQKQKNDKNIELNKSKDDSNKNKNKSKKKI